MRSPTRSPRRSTSSAAPARAPSWRSRARRPSQACSALRSTEVRASSPSRRSARRSKISSCATPSTRAIDAGQPARHVCVVKRVDPEEALRLVRDEGYVYVDVRSVMEFDEGHPEGAYNVPLLDAGPGGMAPNPDFVDVMV